MANTKKRCKQCKSYFPADSMIKVPAGTFCCDVCMFAWLNEKRVKDDKKAHTAKKKASSKDLRDFNRRDLRWQHKQTQKVFNKMRVLEEKKWFADRHLEPTCVSCGKPQGGDQWCCGHFKTRGAQSGLRYDRKNTFLQHNFSCNMRLSGDIAGSKHTRGYRLGLLERFGEEEGQSIIDYCETNTAVVHWTWQDLEEMRKQFNARIRELKNV